VEEKGADGAGVARDRVLWIAVVFALVMLALGLTDAVESDEGVLTYLGAAMTADAPVATLFLQKMHPTLSVLYLPAVALGWRGFIAAHALLGALGVFAIGRWADKLGGDGWLAALTVALSPAYGFSVCTGQSNSDGIALLALGLWLYESDGALRRFAAGVVLGLTVWARYEFGAFVSALGIIAILRPGRRATALGMLAIPLLYLPAGAIYHRDLLWFFHHLPMEAEAAPGLGRVFGVTYNLRGLRRILTAVTLVSSAWPLVLTPAALSERGSARTVVVVGAALLLAFTTSALLGLYGPEVVPRYLSIVLPAVAFAASRARLLRAPRALPWVSAAVAILWFGALLCFSAAGRFEPPTAMVALSALALAGPAAVAWSRGPSRVRALALLTALSSLVVAASPAVAWRGMEPWHSRAREAEAVRRAAAVHRPAVIVTDIQSLTPVLHRAGLPSARYLFSADVVAGLHSITNHRNGQYASASWGFHDHYEVGGGLWPCELARYDFRAGDLVVLGGEFRTRVLVPASAWEADTELVAVVGTATIRRFVRGPVRVRLPTPPPWMTQRVFEAACAVRRPD